MTDLAGAGIPAAENESILSNPATFAAHWNRATEEQRADYLTRIRASFETTSRCYAMNHDGYRELAERQAQLLNLIRAAITDYTRNRPAAEVIDEIGLILQ